MAQKIQTLFIDDIDGGEADGTVRFSLDGTEYEIDLNARHTDELRTTLKSYIEHGRKVGGSARRAAAGRSGRRASSVDTVAVRAGGGGPATTSKAPGAGPGDRAAR